MVKDISVSEMMMKRLDDLLAGILMTIVSGVFLILSFVLSLRGIVLAVDPAWASVVISGIPLLYLAIWRVIFNQGISKISSALLISIAMIAAIAIGDLFAAGEVAFIMAIGAILEDKTTERARRGLEKLIRIVPQTARRIRNGKEEIVAPESIAVGDMIRVLPGESIPVDGVIVSGNTSVDQSVLTGESLPVDKNPGDELYSGTINLYGSVDMKAERVGKDSSLEQLIRLVDEADRNKAPIQRIADRWASWLVPAALLIAIAAYFITGDIVRAVTVLVVFCPCALVLATPTAIMAAIGQATKNGVIIKSGEALEKMGKTNVIAFDKTGTLTYGKPVVSDIILSDGTEERFALSMAASAEKRSSHPLASALVAYAEEKGVELQDPSAFSMEAGRGIDAEVSGHSILCGNMRMMAEHGIYAENAEDGIRRLSSQGKAVMIVAIDGKASLIAAFSDQIRSGAREMLSSLHGIGVRTVLLTGDNPEAAEYIASELGLKDIHSGLLPSQKVDIIGEIQKSGESVAMIGDGVNDAPALKSADTGIAMGAIGSDIAIEAADIALMGDDLGKIPYLKRLSNAAVNTIRLSISLSLCINAVAVTLSILGLLTPTTGALVHNVGSVFVVMLAALLYDRKF